MKLRTHLLLAGAASIAVLLLMLLVSYRLMLLNASQFLWLSGAAVLAGSLSFLLHILLVRPVEKAVSRVAAGAERIAAGDFRAEVPVVGPAEMRELALRFNGMGAELDRSFARIVQAEAARRELVANLAHDLRTPMASVLSYVEALEDGIVADEESFGRYLSTIRSETERLSRLVRDLFELSAYDGASLPHAMEAVSLETLLVDSLQTFELPAADKGIEIRVCLSDPPDTVRCAPKQIVRVLQNLLENALRHAPADSVIRVTAGRDGTGGIRMAVEDRGPGVAESDRDRIFERFYRSDRSRGRESGGTGIGLSIAKAIVDQHDGVIGFDPLPGGGSCFWFSLPEGRNRSECSLEPVGLRTTG